MAAAATTPAARASIDNLLDASHGTAKVTVDDATGVARFIGFPQGLASFQMSGGNASAAAINFFQAYGAAFGIRNASAELSLKTSKVDSLGFTHVTHTQVHEGVAAYAAELRTHIDKNGSLTAVNGVFIPAIEAGSTPKLNAAVTSGVR